MKPDHVVAAFYRRVNTTHAVLEVDGQLSETTFCGRPWTSVTGQLFRTHWTYRGDPAYGDLCPRCVQRTGLSQ